MPAPTDIVYADPRNVMYSYGLSETYRSYLAAESAFTSTITVTYDSGFLANPAAQTAFQAAVDIWQSVISSPVPIRVSASFVPLGTNVLGQAGPTVLCAPTSGVSNTYYAAALADKIAGVAFCAALGGETHEIVAQFSSSFANWDFGASGTPVSGKYNFLTVVMHELGHGLGLYGSMTASGGVGSFRSIPDIYDRFAVTGAGAPLVSFANPSAALGTQLVSNDTHFNGIFADANNGGFWPKLETHHFTNAFGVSSDSGFKAGSSYSHIDDSVYSATPNGLMTFRLGMAEVYTDPGPIVRGIFADLGWRERPAITTQPQSQTIASGQTATLTVSATGTAPLGYQWYAGTSGTTTTPIAGAVSSTYITPPLASPASYWMRVSNGYEFANSATATVSIGAPPAIATPPENLTLAQGQSGSFAVVATGAAPLTYQWQVSANSGASWTNLTTTPSPYGGVTAATLTVTTAIVALNGLQYRCVVTNSAGSAASTPATLTVTTTAGVLVNRYRLYSPITLEHHFTTDVNEYSILGQFSGTWIQEGAASRMHNGPATVSGTPAVPYYRLYDFVLRWHHWTTDRNEYDTLRQITSRYVAEGIDGYIFPTQVIGTTPWYRLLFLGIGGLHHWTADQNERDTLVGSGVWIEEQREYVFPP